MARKIAPLNSNVVRMVRDIIFTPNEARLQESTVAVVSMPAKKGGMLKRQAASTVEKAVAGPPEGCWAHLRGT